MEETKLIWMDGSLTPWKDAKIHMLTHSLHYGAAVFEGLRFYEKKKGPAIFRLKDHTKRLFYSASTLKMKIPFTEEEINKAIIETVKKNSVQSGYIRPLIYLGYGKMGLSPRGAPVNVSIAVWPWGSYLGENPIKVKTSKYMRIHPKSTIADAKITGHYVNSILAGEEAHSQGFDEALLLDYQGNVAEGPGENLFIINENKIYTPKLGNILAGITRDSIIQIAKDLNMKVEEKTLTLEDLYSADEAFYTGTAAEVTPIAQVDDKTIKHSLGPITKQLKEAYENILHGKNDKYKSWLTYVN